MIIWLYLTFINSFLLCEVGIYYFHFRPKTGFDLTYNIVHFHIMERI
jgi:hypothetical protein